MPGSSANGKAGTLRERIAHNQAERERSIAALEGAEWDEEITDTHIHVHVGDTGRFPAAEVPTRPDSSPAPSTPKIARGFVAVLREANTWPKVAALGLLVLLLAAALAWRAGAVPALLTP